MSASPETVCVDASFVVRLLLAGSNDHVSVVRWRQWRDEGLVPVAPALLHYEVANALYRYERMGELVADEVDEALALALLLDIRLVEDDDLHRRAVAAAREYDLGAAYDAHYLALGKRLDCEVWTFDSKLARSVGDKLPQLRLVEYPGSP